MAKKRPFSALVGRTLLLTSTSMMMNHQAVLVAGLPNGYAWGCLPGNVSASLPFCDASLPIPTRVQDLISRLSVQERQSFLGPDTAHTNVSNCNCMDGGNPRLGIPGYLNLVETNSGVASACLGKDQCATSFPGPMGMGAAFNRSLWRRKGEVLSDEMRAFNNINWYRGTKDAPYAKIGLSGFGPNINIARDPRFGRISELPGEDPYLSGSYAVEMVKALQEGDDPRYLKMIAGLKHFTAYSVEDDRASRIFNISMRDLWETYLPQYQMGFAADQGNAAAAMCSYAGINGVPLCANDYVLNIILRGHWDRPDAVIATDCGAINNMILHNKYARGLPDAASKALLGGSDIDLGDGYFSPMTNHGNSGLRRALDQGRVTLDDIDVALTRVLTNRFRTGLFDPLDDQVYTTIGPEVINSTQSHELVLEATLQSMVLLKNDGLLPLQQRVKLAVVGPHATSTRDLFEDYMGDEVCQGGGTDCVMTIGQVLALRNGLSNTLVQQGVDLNGDDDMAGIEAALEAVRASEVVVLCLGDGFDQEHEGIDRPDTLLTKPQYVLAERVLALGKPTVLVLVNGGMVSIDPLVGHQSLGAMVEAFYPGLRAGEALYRALFGLDNRWGRLPITIYPAHYTAQVDMYSFDMALAPGRTYRYYQGQPLFPFGHGLSLTTFHHDCTLQDREDDDSTASIKCTVTNTGSRAGDDVIMVYHRVGEDIRRRLHHPAPLRSLVDFTRLHLNPGEASTVVFDLAIHDKLSVTDEQGNRALYTGSHVVEVTDGGVGTPPAPLTIHVGGQSRFKVVVERVPQPPPLEDEVAWGDPTSISSTA